MKKYLLFIMSLFCLTMAMSQTRYYVKPNGNDGNAGTSWATAFKTVEKALNAASSGEIWVAAGTYQPAAGTSYKMKNNVALYGGFYGNETSLSQRNWNSYKSILKGNGSSVIRNFYTAANPLTRSAILDGFTITNGKGSVSTNGAGTSGGGIYNEYASIYIKNCIIENCEARAAGGIYNNYSSPKIENTIIRNNTATAYDGGGSVDTKSPTEYIYVSVLNNTAAKAGGGVFSGDDNNIMTNCFIQGNRASRGGGAFRVKTMINVVITGNYATNYGGGIDNCNFDCNIINGTIAGNYCAGQGGGIYNDNTSAWLSKMFIYNSVIWGNKTASASNGMNIYNGNIAYCTLENRNSLIEGSRTGNTWNSGFGTDLGGNIDGNPLFFDYQYASATGASSAGDFNIREGSIAINKGNNNFNWITTDLTGQARVVDGTIDMGAYERRVVTILYVNQNATATYKNGESWERAYTNLAEALNRAGSNSSIKQIWVAKGTYQPAAGTSYKMINNVALYGGFYGNETSLSQRNWNSYKSILKGNGSSVIRNLYTASNPLTRTAILDGFTITNGIGSQGPSGEGAGIVGGGIYNDYASIYIKNCIIENCEARAAGGIYNNYSSPKIENTIIRNNKATIYDGGGSVDRYSSTEYVNVSLLSNTASSAGGGIFSGSGNNSLINCYIQGNRASRGGGAFRVKTMINVVITGNYATDYGGGVDNCNYDGTIINGTIAGNYCSGQGGGVYNGNTSAWLAKLYMYNTIVWGNKTSNSSFGPNVYNGNTSYCTIENYYNLIEGCKSGNTWNTAFGTNFGGNINADPCFVDYRCAAASAPTLLGDFYIYSSGAGIGRGNNSYNTTSTDVSGLARIINGTIDMGAYELQLIDWAARQTPDLTGFSSINETENGNGTFKLYPNPVYSGNALTVEIDKDPSSNTLIELFDSKGMRVSCYPVTEKNSSISMPTTKGVFILRITSPDGFSKTEKVIVK